MNMLALKYDGVAIGVAIGGDHGNANMVAVPLPRAAAQQPAHGDSSGVSFWRSALEVWRNLQVKMARAGLMSVAY